MLHAAHSGVNRKEYGAVSEIAVDIEVCREDVLSLVYASPCTDPNLEATCGKALTKCELHVVLSAHMTVRLNRMGTKIQNTN